jgi:SRSO17 transposase
MSMRAARRTLERWDAYLAGIGSRLADKGQRAWFAMYALGLLSDAERKNIEPIAVRACGTPDRMRCVHEYLDRCLVAAPWPDAAVRAHAAQHAVKALEARGPVRAWVVDETAFAGGKCAPGTGPANQSQVGVGLLLASDHAHVATDFRLYLPEEWAADRKRCRRADVPEHVGYAPRWCLALDMIEAALASELSAGVVLAGPDYGSKAQFRDALSALGLRYALEIKASTKLRCVHPDGARGPRIEVAELGRMLESRLRRVSWPEGEHDLPSSRFARARVALERDDGTERPPQWLLVEWPEGASAPSRFVLSTMDESSCLRELVHSAKSRWRFACAQRELKRELGRDRYQGRSFAGWHHHLSVVLACSAFLVAQRARVAAASRANRSGPLHRAA